MRAWSDPERWWGAVSRHPQRKLCGTKPKHAGQCSGWQQLKLVRASTFRATFTRHGNNCQTGSGLWMRLELRLILPTCTFS